MQIQYQLNLDDVAAYNWHHSLNSKAANRTSKLLSAWGILLCLYIAFRSTEWNMSSRIIFFVIASAFWLFVYPLFRRKAVERQARRLYGEGKNRDVIGNHIFAIDKDGITEISDVAESHITWSGIERIEENDKYIFLYTGSLSAHIIPKRAFVNKEEESEFIQLTRTYYSENSHLTIAESSAK